MTAPERKRRQLTARWYATAFSAEERALIRRQLRSPELTTEMEVAIMRVMISRVIECLGEDDPAGALPLVRQGVDAVCRALRAERVIQDDVAQALQAVFAEAVRQIRDERMELRGETHAAGDEEPPDGGEAGT